MASHHHPLVHSANRSWSATHYLPDFGSLHCNRVIRLITGKSMVKILSTRLYYERFQIDSYEVFGEAQTDTGYWVQYLVLLYFFTLKVLSTKCIFVVQVNLLVLQTFTSLLVVSTNLLKHLYLVQIYLNVVADSSYCFFSRVQLSRCGLMKYFWDTFISVPTLLLLEGVWYGWEYQVCASVMLTENAYWESDWTSLIADSHGITHIQSLTHTHTPRKIWI